MRRMFKYAYISGLIKLNPLSDTSGAIQKSRQKPHPCIIDGIYNKQERKLAIGKLLLDIHSFSGNWVNQMALILMANIFQRPSEICGLRWENIDFYEGLINLHASETDTKTLFQLANLLLKY